MGSRQNRYLHRPRLARGDQSYLVTPPTTRAFLATRSAYTYLRAPSWISTYRVHPEFCAARAFRRDGRYFAGLHFSTPRVMHDGMDSRRNHIQTVDTVTIREGVLPVLRFPGFQHWALQLDPFCASRRF